LMLGTGTGSEIRQPPRLRDGRRALAVSQALTLFTTPIVYLSTLDKAFQRIFQLGPLEGRRCAGRRRARRRQGSRRVVASPNSLPIGVALKGFYGDRSVKFAKVVGDGRWPSPQSPPPGLLSPQQAAPQGQRRRTEPVGADAPLLPALLRRHSPAWAARCSSPKPRRPARMRDGAETRSSPRTGQLVVLVNISRGQATTRTPIALVQLPLGLNLQAGAKFSGR